MRTMQRFLPVTLATLIAITLSACSTARDGAGDDTTAARTPDGDTMSAVDTPAPRASTPAIHPDSLPPMVTDTAFRFRPWQDGVAADIRYSYTNRWSDTLFLVNCNGNVAPGLQRLDGGEWKTWWIPASNACLSPPVTIAPGATYVDSLSVIITPQDGRLYNELMVANTSGIYRLIWTQALLDFDPRTRGFGTKPPIERTVSNAFRLLPVE